MSSKPKFEVGEVVILQSVDNPEFNGEYSVHMIVSPGQVYIDPFHGTEWKDDGRGIGYILNDPRLSDTDDGPLASITWSEDALRKKHLPGSLSFRDLVQTLKDPSKCQNA